MAYQILSQVYSIHATRLPAYHFKRLFKKDDMHMGTRSNDEYRINRVDFNLSLCRTSFVIQSSRLWSSLLEKQALIQEKVQVLGEEEYTDHALNSLLSL